MLSLKRYLRMPDGEPGQQEVFTLLLNTVATRMPCIDAARFESFCCGVRKLQAEMIEATDAEQTTLAGVKLAESIDRYSRSLEKSVLEERTELRSIIAMLSQTLTEITRSSQKAAAALRSVERDLSAASELTDLRAVRGKLAESLKVVCEQAAVQQEQAASTEAQLGVRVRISESDPSSYRACSLTYNDAITGLPSLEGAQERIIGLIEGGRRAWLALFFVERLTAVNQRFGFAAGDQMILLFSQHIAQQLRPTDQLFRWRGPLFVAILERTEAPIAIGAEVRRIATSHFDYSVTIGTREIMVPISATFSVLPVKPSSSPEALFATIDAFASNERNRAPANPKPA
jgi:GGDEF domain-containing protein